MDETTRMNLVSAAVIATGPATQYANAVQQADGSTINVVDEAAYQSAVRENAIAIAVMASENGPIGKALDQLANSRPFIATIAAVEKEQSSTRAFITLHTGTERSSKGPGGRELPAGYEGIRTERTDNPVGRSLAIKARNLIGHRVTVWIENEALANGSGQTVRVLRHVEDLGWDSDANSKVIAA